MTRFQFIYSTLVVPDKIHRAVKQLCVCVCVKYNYVHICECTCFIVTLS